ncbi:hypothetical protein GmHk_17G049216 [Glycine max]|nr:hypothetical protein GmHk_17G049216 [Glycine max]
MSVEQFIEKVAWAGAQPSFVGDNESFTAQAPQQHEPEPENDHSSEATIFGAVDYSSIPVLEIHEGQTIPVLPLDTSPSATLVWHLTDEKNVQIQDNQDQLNRQLLQSAIFHSFAKPSCWLNENSLSATFSG